MWKEVILDEDFSEAVSMNDKFGCSVNRSFEMLKTLKEQTEDCHFYFYKDNRIELFIGNKRNYEPDGTPYVFVITYAIKADGKDYPKALEILALKGKEYLKSRKETYYIIGFGSDDVSQIDTYNKGITPIGFNEVVRLAKIEYEKVGFKLTYDRKRIKVELV